MTEKCVRCGAREDQIKLFDTIYDGKANCICERCSIIENVSILERPDSNKIRESNRVVDVYEKMKRMTGKNSEKKESEERKNRLEELRKNPQLEIPEKKSPELIDHFHWEIMKCRRRKGLSHNQLGEIIREPGFSIEMIEKGNLGENAEVLIKKLEKFFNIQLIKLSSLDLMKRDERKMPILLDEDGNVLETIPEPAVKMRGDLFLDEEFGEGEEENNRFFTNFLNKFKKSTTSSSSDDENSNIIGLSSKDDIEDSEISGEETGEIEDFDLDNVDKDKVKISDLREWHRRRIESTKNERIEEQKKIEEREKLIEARKEELKLIKEKDSKEIDTLLGGAELLKKEVLNGFEKDEQAG